MPLYIHWGDEMIVGNLCIITDEVCSIPFISKGSVVACIENLIYSKVCSSWGTTGTDRCTQKDEESKLSLLVGTNTAIGSESFLLQIIMGNESILNPNPSASYGMAPYNIPKEEESEECAVS